MPDIYLAIRTYEQCVARIMSTLTNGGSSEAERQNAFDRIFAGVGISDVERIKRIRDALLALEVSAWSGRFDECDVKLLIGEIGGLWPAHLLSIDLDSAKRPCGAKGNGLSAIQARAMRSA